MNGRRLGVAAVLFSTMLFAGSASADEEQCSADISRGVYLMRAGLLVEAREAMQAAGDDCVRAREQAADLAWRIPKVFLHVAGRGRDEVTVLVDGSIIDRDGLANALRLNPGEHVFVARASDGAERHVTFVLAEGETRSVSIDFLAGTMVETAPAPPANKAEAPVSPLVYAGFGVGALGLAVGIGGAVASRDQVSDLMTRCVDARCPASAADDIDSARRWATISTVGFVTAAIGAGVGIFGLLLPKIGTPKRETPTTRVSVGPASVGVAGTF